MNLTRRAIENDRVTAVALLIVLVGGFYAYFSLPRDYDPGFTVRIAQVITYFPGAGPERVERLVTDKLEKTIQEIPELDYVESQSKNGVSIVFAHVLERYTEMRPIWDSLRRKVDRAVPDLPDGVVGPFVDDEFGDVYGIIIGVTGEGFSYAELKTVADEVRDELLLLENAAKVKILGAQAERVFMEYRNARLADLNLSPANLMAILESRNIIIPGGAVEIDTERIVVEPSGNFESVDEMRRAVIRLPRTGEVLYLGDLVEIRRGYIDPPRSKMRVSGEPALALAVSMREGGNLMALGDAVNALLDRLRTAYPYGVDFVKTTFQPREVDRKVVEFRNNLLQAIAVVMAVMLLTLGIRTGLLVATLIPMTILMAMLIMYYLGIGLDQMSLASLIIALGMLVDNAIVMSESIMVEIASGRKAVEAAVSSAGELVVPLLTSSLTTAAAFLPIYLAESDTGEYTAPLFKVVAITLLSSWVLALTMIPLLCVKFLKPKPTAGKESHNTRFHRGYRRGLLLALRHRWITLTLVALLFGLTLFSTRYLPVIFFPPSERTYFKAEIHLPMGTAIEATEATVIEIEEFMERELMAKGKNGRGESAEGEGGVTHWVTYVGEGGPRFVLQHTPEVSSPEYALMVVDNTSVAAMDRTMARLEAHVAGHFPDVDLILKKIENGPPIEYPVEIRIIGRETDRVFDIADRVKRKLAETPGTRNIGDDWGRRTKKIVVKVDQPRALRAGVTSRDIAVSLQTGLSGMEVTDYREGDDIIPVVLRSVAADRRDVANLRGLNVHVQATGESVPLLQVADIEVEWQPPKIIRKNRLKTVTVHTDLDPGVTASQVTTEVVPWLDKESEGWGVGYRYELGGEAETSRDANASIMVNLPVAGFIIVMLLVIQFNSLRRPAIILITIPLGFIGVVLGLFATGLYFGFMTLLGIVSLSGIVINNAIVLLERIHLEITENHLDPPKAVIEAAQRRMRPILLTTATTAFGMAPLYFGGGAMWKPMAVAIIAGLLFATLLTLGVVPVLYAVLFRLRFKG